MNKGKITVIGAGLAGSEAAWQAAEMGNEVTLYEMKPGKFTPAHSYAGFGELVCSNSLRGEDLANGPGLLKEELRRLGSVIMSCADSSRVPAGGALAVDRKKFSDGITEKIRSHPNITVVNREVAEIPPDRPLVVATGPLTSEALSVKIQGIMGKQLYFYDAAAPIVSADSIDMEKAFWASRYGKGDSDYLNCPMTRDEYERFYDALISAETTGVREFEKEIFFEGCMPVEEIAGRGKETLLFGPLKPVGIKIPGGGSPYAVVQLRKENTEGTMFNLVGFQTHLKWGEQKRVFSMIPGLENAEFMRYGVMHRNTYINSPGILNVYSEKKDDPGLFFAGQMTGVEGYVESAASGLAAGINAALAAQGREKVVFPEETAIGALLRYISGYTGKNFQPMNINFGLLPKVEGKKIPKKERKRAAAERALRKIDEFISSGRM